MCPWLLGLLSKNLGGWTAIILNSQLVGAKLPSHCYNLAGGRRIEANYKLNIIDIGLLPVNA